MREATIENVNMVEAVRELGLAGVRAGTPGDAVLGVMPESVVSPGSVAEVSALLGWANERGLKVVPCGTRTKLDRGAPPRGCDILLDMSGLSGVVEHAAGDLTVTVRAGTRLEDLQATLAGAGQFLAIDPPVPGTVGGLIAIGDSGPRRLRYGGVRDLILGVTFVRADGVVARGGGKVVKNVAGYDLPKLFTGCLGTLGVIIEATFRLYPLPASSTTVAVESITAQEAGRIAQTILHSYVVLSSLDYFCDADGESMLAVRFEGSPRSTQAQATQAAEMLGTGHRSLDTDGEAALLARFDGITRTEDGDVLARLISTTTELPGLIESAQNAGRKADTPLSLRAHLGHGHALLRWHQPATPQAVEQLLRLRQQADALASNLVVWRAPLDVRKQVDVWGDVGEGLPLMKSIKAQFDPNNTLNPGRFVGGI